MLSDRIGKEYIDTNKIFKALHFIKQSGHPYYQFFESFLSYKNRCKDKDPDGHDLIFGEDPANIEDENRHTEELNDDEEDDYLKYDVIRKYQFDHNKNTSLTENYPEPNVDENGKTNGEFSFAPGEGHSPANILEEKDWDLKSWPLLLADGKYGLHYPRKIRLTEQQYFCQRLLNKDLRFCKSTGFIFSAAAYIEKK